MSSLSAQLWILSRNLVPSPSRVTWRGISICHYGQAQFSSVQFSLAQLSFEPLSWEHHLVSIVLISHLVVHPA